MNRFPGEIVVDVFVQLDRSDLEALQLSCRRFRRLVNLKMRLLCLRQIEKLRFSPAEEGHHRAFVRSGEVEKECVGSLDEIVRFLSNVVYAADVRSLEVVDISLTRELREKLATIVPFMTVHCADFTRINFTNLDTLSFRSSLFNFASITGVCFDSVRLRRNHISDFFLKECCERGITVLAVLHSEVQGCNDQFPNVSDDGIVNFCFGTDKKNKRLGKERCLCLDGYVGTSSRLIHRLVEASANCAETADIRLWTYVNVHGLRELGDFKANAEKSKRGMDYKFPGDSPLRITLKRDETLELARGSACEDDSFFDF